MHILYVRVGGCDGRGCWGYQGFLCAWLGRSKSPLVGSQAAHRLLQHVGGGRQHLEKKEDLSTLPRGASGWSAKPAERCGNQPLFCCSGSATAPPRLRTAKAPACWPTQKERKEKKEEEEIRYSLLLLVLPFLLVFSSTCWQISSISSSPFPSAAKIRVSVSPPFCLVQNAKPWSKKEKILRKEASCRSVRPGVGSVAMMAGRVF